MCAYRGCSNRRYGRYRGLLHAASGAVTLCVTDDALAPPAGERGRGKRGESEGDERGKIILTNWLRRVDLQEHRAVMRRIDDEPWDEIVIALVEQFPHV